MSPSEEQELLSFLLTCSHTSRADFLLARLNRDKEYRKQLRALMERIVENLAMVHVANFLRDHSSEIAAATQLPSPRVKELSE